MGRVATTSLRGTLVRVHRWVGLATAIFLAIAGLTGAVIAFNHELDEWLNPDLFRVEGRGNVISSLALAARIEAVEPRMRVAYVPLEVEPGHSIMLGVAERTDPATGKPYDLGYNQVFLDPVTGARLGEREWGAVRLDRAHLIPFLYALHYSLHLPERWGIWLMGVVALAWALDCFVGFCLTLPARRRSAAAHAIPEDAGGDNARSFWQRWKPSWKIKTGASAYRLNFGLHRAGGLWFWGLLLMMSVSAVYLNLQFELFRPVLSLVAPVTPSPFEQALSRRGAAPVDPVVSYAAVVADARREAVRRGWPAPFDAYYSAEFGIYGVGFGDHHAPGIGVPYLYYDGGSGKVLGQTVPGQGTAGDVLMQWMFPLHSGQIIGLTGRIIACVTGLAVATLSITGIVIWARKQRKPASDQDRREPNIVQL